MRGCISQATVAKYMRRRRKPPEAAVQGYPRVSLPEGKSADAPDFVAERARIIAAAEPNLGPATERFARLARELGV